MPSDWMVGKIGWNWMGVGVGEGGVAMVDTPTGVLNVDSSEDVLSALTTLVVSTSDDGGTVVLELITADGDTLSERLKDGIVTSEDDSVV